MRPLRTAALFTVGLALSACGQLGQLFGVQWSSRLGSIDSTSIVVPDSVTANSPFGVSFITTGGGCNRIGDTQVKLIDARTAEIRPFDDAEVNPSACNAIEYLFHHSALLEFGLKGNATVRLIGAFNDSTITYTRTVVVH